MRQRRRRHFAFVLLRWLTWPLSSRLEPSVGREFELFVLPLHVRTRLRRLLMSSYLGLLNNHPPK
jgi:hypothetical protein